MTPETNVATLNIDEIQQSSSRSDNLKPFCGRWASIWMWFVNFWKNMPSLAIQENEKYTAKFQEFLLT